MRGRPLESKTKESAYATWAIRRIGTSIVLLALLFVLVHIMARAGFGMADKIDVVAMILGSKGEKVEAPEEATEGSGE